MGLYKRKKVWWMSFVYRGRQIRQSSGTWNRKLAQSILSKLRVQIVEGEFFDRHEEADRTVTEMMERYLAEHSVTKVAKSQKRDRQIIGLHLLPCMGEMTLADVTPKVVTAYKARRREEGSSADNTNKELGILRNAFNLARREWEWCRENPVQSVRMEKVKTRIDRWLTHEEEKRLLAAGSDWLGEVVVFALNTGMRQGEIIAVCWEDVDLARGVVVVPRSKNNEPRTIPLNSQVYSVLAVKDAKDGSKTGLVFRTSRGTVMKPRNLSRAFDRAVLRAGIKNFRFHDMRHTFATRMVQADVDLYKVQRLLGHKTMAMTQRYAHHCPESLRSGVKALDVASQNELSHFYHTRPTEERVGFVSS